MLWMHGNDDAGKVLHSCLKSCKQSTPHMPAITLAMAITPPAAGNLCKLSVHSNSTYYA
jgi:hypothetical protein